LSLPLSVHGLVTTLLQKLGILKPKKEDVPGRQ
jgi:hypothetical protein